MRIRTAVEYVLYAGCVMLVRERALAIASSSTAHGWLSNARKGYFRRDGGGSKRAGITLSGGTMDSRNASREREKDIYSEIAAEDRCALKLCMPCTYI